MEDVNIRVPTLLAASLVPVTLGIASTATGLTAQVYRLICVYVIRFVHYSVL